MLTARRDVEMGRGMLGDGKSFRWLKGKVDFLGRSFPKCYLPTVSNRGGESLK